MLAKADDFHFCVVLRLKDTKRVLVKYKVDKVRKVGEAKLHISLKIEQCGNVGKVEWAKLAKLGLLFPQILISE